MREYQQATNRPTTLHRTVCAHRFETAEIGKCFIPDLLVCQDCGQ
jgi:hypothetical protein